MQNEWISVHLMYWLNAILIGFSFHTSFRHQRVYSMLWGALGAFHLIAYIDLLSSVSQFDNEVLIKGQAIMFFGNMILAIVFFLFDKGPLTLEPSLLPKRLPRFFGVESQRSHYYLHMMMIAAAVAIGIQFKDGLSVANSDWIAQRMVADPYYLRPISTMLGFVFFSGIWVAIRLQKVWIGLLLGLAILVLFFISGSRAMFTTIAGAIYLDIMTSRINQRSKLTLLLGIALAAYAMHVLLRVLRGMGLAGFITGLMTGSVGTWIDGHQGKLGLGGEEGTYQTFYYVVEKDYDYAPYRTWVTPRRVALMYLPTSVAPSLKPADITTQLWYDGFDDGLLDDSHDIQQLEVIAATDIGGSIHPHLWGEAYANGHPLGVALYAIVLGLLAVSVERILLRSTQLSFFTLTPCICVGYMFIARGSVVAGFGCVLYTLPMVVAIALASGTPLFQRIRTRKQNRHRQEETT